MDVGGWLRNLGLDKYEAAFRENGIDEQVLRHVTAEDLREIGVATVGDRRKLLAAIADLTAPSPSTQTRAPPSPAPRPETPVASAERRPITVMFCDLVGSTALAAKLDAEDWRNLVNAYLDEASRAVTELGGHVLKKLGDGLMVLFGYPRAQENDAERGVRAALAIQRVLAEINAKNAGKGAPQLSARIGLESGPVVVEATGEVFGEAPNIAARVQGLAEPGAVLVSANVQRQTAGLFVAEDGGTYELKGVPAPVTLYRIVRASGGRRFGARALTPLVGREEELDLLRRRWERAVKGEGQLALVVGEPGIGKSRLVEEFRLRLGETPHTWSEFSSSQLLQNTPLHPIAEWGRQRFGGADTPASQRLADLENTLRLIGLDAAEYAPLLAPLVDVPLPEDRAAKLAPEELRRRQLAAMTTWVLAGARSQPIALAFEDLHWADPTSLDLMQALAERGAQAPLFILATARPEFRPPWSLRSHHSVISLSPLDRADVARMVGELAASHVLSREVVEGVSERTGGVPLFVEEVTRLLLERGEAGGLQAIPPTLQQSLAARLDRLGEAREVAQIGAVLGRDFSYALLRAVGKVEDSALQSALDRLAGADLLIAEGSGHEASYRFKHALIQDAAYDSLLKTRRQALHRRAAEMLVGQPERAAAEPEVIAHHFTAAGLDELAIEWWGKAGDQALRHSAFQEAIAHLGKAITMADNAAAGTAAGTSGERARLHAAYANALIPARGYGARETTAAFARARELAAGDKDAPGRLAADYGLWVGSFTRGELPEMRAQAAAFLNDVEARPDSPEAGVALRVAGATCWFAGEYREARDHLERALALFQPGHDDDMAFRFGQDLGVSAMAYLALVLLALGEIERAVSLVRDAQARIAGLAHISTRASGNFHTAVFELMRGDLPRAAAHGVELALLTRQHDLLAWRPWGVFLEGLAAAESGAPGGGLEDMRRGVELLREQNILQHDGLYKMALAEAEARAGTLDRALAILDEALATSERIGHRTFDAELHRARGEMLLKRDPANPAPAEEAFQAAIAVAKQQATRSFELRAALALAKLYQSTARPAEAHAVLAPALESFSPTPEMPEVAEARAVLSALAETEEVKATIAQRRRRLDLQTSYGQALLYGKRFAAEETRAAFARAAEFARPIENPAARFTAYFGQCTGSFVRGEFPRAQEIAETFLREAEADGRAPEAGTARRLLAVVLFFQGDLKAARSFLERGLAEFVPERNGDAWHPDGQATGTAVLASVVWHLGEVGRARLLIQQAIRRARELGHAATLVQVLTWNAYLEIRRDDVAAARLVADAWVKSAEEYGMNFFAVAGQVCAHWTSGRLVDPEEGANGLRLALQAYMAQGNKMDAPWFHGMLAELEAATRGPDSALTLIDQGLTIAEETGGRFMDPYLHRLRGDILLKRDPADPALAEDAYRTAVAIAKQQGARSYQLLASLSLAKLYQSTARPADAHDVLVPALEGFFPTPEMPEIREAEELLASLAQWSAGNGSARR
jgi:class 3 adenylate cyclase/predicted ATPase